MMINLALYALLSLMAVAGACDSKPGKKSLDPEEDTDEDLLVKQERKRIQQDLELN